MLKIYKYIYCAFGKESKIKQCSGKVNEFNAGNDTVQAVYCKRVQLLVQIVSKMTM